MLHQILLLFIYINIHIIIVQYISSQGSGIFCVDPRVFYPHIVVPDDICMGAFFQTVQYNGWKGVVGEIRIKSPALNLIDIQTSYFSGQAVDQNPVISDIIPQIIHRGNAVGLPVKYLIQQGSNFFCIFFFCVFPYVFIIIFIQNIRMGAFKVIAVCP